MELIEKYAEYLQNQGKAENTIQTYIGHVRRYMEWYQESFGEECAQLYRINILDYASYLQNIQKLEFSTINNKLSALSSLNEFLVKSGVQEEVVLQANDYRKTQPLLVNPSDLSERDVQEFLQRVLVDTGTRNYAIAAILAYGGLRVSECIALKRLDLDMTAMELRVIGKGRKKRIVYLNDKIIHAVKVYLKERRSDSEYLFISRNGGKLHRSSVNRFFKSCSDTVTPHKLRHYFCSHALGDAGYSIAEVANQAGHSDSRTTLRYTHPKREQMKEKAKRL